MTIESGSQEILRIRKRLEDIEEERLNLPGDAFGEKADLLDEEHQLNARLAELRTYLSEIAHEITQEIPLDPAQGGSR